METVKISAFFCILEKVTGPLLSQLGGRSDTQQSGFSSVLYSRTLREAFVVLSRTFPYPFKKLQWKFCMTSYSQPAPALVIAQNSAGRESETGWSAGHMLRCAEGGKIVQMLNRMNFAVLLLSFLWRKLSVVKSEPSQFLCN